jgi:glycosyltransferase involved in cell wall biosynthesis
VLAEANAAGVPVVAMDRGSCREVIRDGVTGFLVDGAEGAARVLDRFPELNRMACRQRVEQCFSVDTMVRGYEQVYAEILEREARKVA